MLLALMVRVLTVQRAENICRDGSVHLTMARELANSPAGQVARNYQHHPGYAAVVGAVAGLFGAPWPDGWILVGRCVSIIMSIAALAALYSIAAAVFDSRIALITVLLVGIGRTFTEISSDVISDTQAFALAAWAIAFGLHGRKLLRLGSGWVIALAAAAGLAAGGAYLTRPEGLISGAVALALLAVVPKTPRRARGIQTLAVATLVIAILACVLPYALTIGSLTMKKSIGDFVFAGTSLPLAAAGWHGQVLHAMRKTLDRGRSAISTGVFVLVAVCWATWVGRYVLRLSLPKAVVIRPSRVGVFVMFAPAVVFVIMLTAMEFHLGPKYISSRHALLGAMMMTPTAGAGLITLVEWTMLAVRKLRIKPMPSVALACWLLGVMAFMMIRALPVLHEGKACYRAAGLAVRNKYGEGKFILAYDGRVLFFAGAPAEQFHFNSKMPYHLKPADTASADALFARAVGDGERRYDFVAVGKRLAVRFGQPNVLDRLRADPRFQTVGGFLSGDEHNEEVWVFRIRRGE